MAPSFLLPGVTVLAAVPPVVLGWLIWQDRREPGARPFLATLGIIVFFDVGYALSMVVDNPWLHRQLYVLLPTAILLSSITWLLFALEYTGRHEFTTRPIAVGLVAIPTVATAIHFTPGLRRLIVTDHEIVRYAGVNAGELTFGPLGLGLAVVGFVSLLIAIALCLTFVVTDRHRYGLQASVLSFIIVLQHLTTTAYIFDVSPLYFSPYTWAVGCLLALLATTRWDLFGFAPAVLRVGQAVAFDDLGEALVIVDEKGRVVDLNERAVTALDCRKRAAVQQPIETVLGTDVDVESGDQAIRLQTQSSRRDFVVSASPVEGSWGETIGYTLVFHDVTDVRRRRQRLEVLNRVLRHNLRNGLNAILGFTREVEPLVEGQRAWMVDRMEAQSKKLSDLSEKAHKIDRVTTATGPTSDISLAAVAEAVADRLRADHPGVSVTVTVPDGLAVTTDERVFTEVIGYAAESVLRYNDTDDPRLVVSAAPTDTQRPWVTCTVTTNGDAVPVDEQRVIERGEETPLDHSHDLDLWLVSWGVDTLGGDFGFITDDEWPGVRVSIPDLAETDASLGVDGDPRHSIDVSEPTPH